MVDVRGGGMVVDGHPPTVAVEVNVGDVQLSESAVNFCLLRKVHGREHKSFVKRYTQMVSPPEQN